MSLVSPHQIVLDLTSVETQRGRKPNWVEVLYLGLGAGTGAAVFLAEPSRLNVAPLLTATSILTGLTFALALRFWERSIDARRDPFVATDAARLNLIDRLKAHLIWTVLVGVGSTLLLALIAIFGRPYATPLAVTACAATLIVYQIVLVGGGLIEFYRASYDLR